MYDLALVLILHLSLLQLLGRRLPAGRDAESSGPASRRGASPPGSGLAGDRPPSASLETARHMIERAYPASCGSGLAGDPGVRVRTPPPASDLQDDGRSSSRD